MKIFSSLILILSLLSTCLYAEEVTKIPLTKSELGTFLVKVQLGERGKISYFSLDTGATVSAISLDVAKELEEKGQAFYYEETFSSLGDGTVILLPLYRVKQLKIGDNCVVKDFLVTAVPNKKQMLLGLSELLTFAPFTILKEPTELWLSNCDTFTKTH